MITGILRKKFNIAMLAIFVCGFLHTKLAAQDSTFRRNKVAVFAPLYLDSAFVDDTTYRYAKNIFPKFINPGLEFYEGVKLAFDSLNYQKVPLEVFIYDTRSADATLLQQLNSPEMDSVGLIIAHCSSSEVKTFADAGLRKNIPVINVNLPNDGGVSANPYFILLNSTLRTQCEGIYHYIQKYYSLHSLIVFRKKGQQEDRVRSYFDEFGRNTVGVRLKMNYIDLPDSFSVNQLRTVLDSTTETLCIAGSLDESFGKRLAQELSILKKQYPVTLMGMPTWDNIKEFNKPEYRGLEIIYSTPFYNGKGDKVSQSIVSYFNRVMFARPSDMVFRGYEIAWKYGQLLAQYGKDLSSNLANKQNSLFTDFDIQPVVNKQTMTLDYFENKRLYFLKWQDGMVKEVISR